jgi:hypothetical protein
MTKQIEVAFSTGELRHHPGISEQYNWLVYSWDSEEVSENTPEERRWWEFWKLDTSQKKSLLVIIRYLIEALDDFVRIALKEENPLEYKSTVLFSMSDLYDKVIKEFTFPWYLKLFKTFFKNFFINNVCTLLFDFFIKKETSKKTIVKEEKN